MGIETTLALSSLALLISVYNLFIIKKDQTDRGLADEVVIKLRRDILLTAKNPVRAKRALLESEDYKSL